MGASVTHQLQRQTCFRFPFTRSLSESLPAPFSWVWVMFNVSSKVRSLITPLSPSPSYLNTWDQICPWNRTNLISLLCKPGRYPDSNLCKGDFPMVQWSRCCASTAGGTGLIPSQGIKIPYASWLNPNKKQTKPINMQGAQKRELGWRCAFASSV